MSEKFESLLEVKVLSNSEQYQENEMVETVGWNCKDRVYKSQNKEHFIDVKHIGFKYKYQWMRT